MHDPTFVIRIENTSGGWGGDYWECYQWEIDYRNCTIIGSTDGSIRKTHRAIRRRCKELDKFLRNPKWVEANG